MVRVRESVSRFDVAALLGAAVLIAALPHASHTRLRASVVLDLEPSATTSLPGQELTWDRVVIDLAPPERIASPTLAPHQRKLATDRAEQRLRQALTHDLLYQFKLFLYVSKAEQGPLAQRMFVFDRRAHDALHLLYAWPVSTGREKIERTPLGLRVSTNTPAGYYQLDRQRFYEHYRSRQWDEAMPYAMFFNWVDRGRKTGLAIHGADAGGLSQLGSRASAGCVRLSPKNARTLFELIRSRYKGYVPKFAFDTSATMSNNGALMRDAHGTLKLTKGYKVLVLIENTSGGGAVAAVL